jgi:hypothetical protein
VYGTKITVRGNVVNGEVKIGTAFIGRRKVVDEKICKI